MTNTKKNILLTALRLFARDGYEAVSVSRIAGELGMTKGALYKHYKNKRDIFDSIFAYVCELDVQRSRQAGVPEKEFSEMPQSFSGTTADSIMDYMRAQFFYWTQDEIACNFRRMLTLEQYRNEEMKALYQKVMASGPMLFLEDLFRETMKCGTWKEGDPKEMAVEFYAPFYLLLSISDGAADKIEKENAARLFAKHMENFMERYRKDLE